MGGGALDVSTVLPLVWAQATTLSSGSSGLPTTTSPSLSTTLMLALLALRRWCGSLTLSQPDAALGPISGGLWAWLVGLAALLLLALSFQGPVRAIGQLLDVPGHARLLSSALGRFRRSGRLLMVAVGVSVVAWTANQTFSYSVATGRDDELLLIKGHRLSDVAANQGYLAAMTPLRDVVGLGLIIPLLVGASVVLFQYSTDRWGSGIRPPLSIRRRSSRWATIGWGSTGLYALYRFVSLVTGNAELPLGGCIFLEALVVPMLMAFADGVVVAWVLVELRNAGLGDAERDSLDVVGVTVLIPAAILASVLAFPSRYVGSGVWLGFQYLPPGYTSGTWVASYVGWQLGWGLVYLQGAAVVAAGLFGAVAWSRGTPGDALKGYLRLLSNEGGHLVAAVAAGGLAAGALSAVAYFVVLSLPTSTWALNAADSYAHYATLPIGLVLLAALIELGERSLPLARLARSEVDELLA
jgi:hypothetical protein